jgi:hypothetical protein
MAQSKHSSEVECMDIEDSNSPSYKRNAIVDHRKIKVPKLPMGMSLELIISSIAFP